jgi:hypothetical protein
MKKTRILTVLSVAFAIGLMATTIADARGGSRSSSRSSSSRSSSSRSSGGWGSKTRSKPAPKPAYVPKKATTRKAAVKPASTPTTKPTAKPTVAKARKAAPKARSGGGYGKKPIAGTSVSKTKLSKADKTTSKKDATAFKKMNSSSPAYKKTNAELTKNIGKSGKTYRSRTEATRDMRNKMASKNTGFAKGSARPSYVPNTYMVGGISRNSMLVGGCWGYMDPVTAMFIGYGASHMVVNNSMLHSYGYRPVAHRPVYTSPLGIICFLLGFVALIVVIGVIVERAND